MDDFKTVEASDAQTKKLDPLQSMKREGVERMRTSLLSCSMDNISSAKFAIQQVTVLRIYHQVLRIVKYLDLMDKLEEKLYDSIEYTVENAPEANPSTWMMLLNIQEKLQKNIIESHKLLQPFMELQDSNIMDLLPQEEVLSNSAAAIIPSESREKIRNTAQAVLMKLNAG